MNKKLMFLVGLIFVLMFSLSYSVLGNLDTDLHGYYSFDSNAKDNTTGGNDGTVTGASLVSDCKINGCYNFDGSEDRIDYSSATIDLGEDFSVSMWINISNWNVGVSRSMLVNAENGDCGSGWTLRYDDDSGNKFNLYNPGSGTTNTWTTETYSENVWYYVVYVYNKSGTIKNKLYVNGALQTLDNTGVTPVNSGIDTYAVGGCSADAGSSTEGRIDEVGFWNRTLDTTEIASLYNVGAGLPYPLSTSSPVFQITNTNAYNGESINIYSATIVNGTGTQKSFSTTNGTINTNISLTGTQLLNISLYAAAQNYTQTNYTGTNTSSSLSATMIPYWYNTLNFTSQVLESQKQTIQLIVNTTSDIDDADATLDYPNATITSLSKTFYTDHYVFEANFTTPNFATTKNVTFQWNLSLDIKSGAIILQDQINITTGTQQVITIGLDNCSTYTTQAMLFNLKNETSGDFVNGTVAAYFQTYVDSSTGSVPFNITWNTNTTFPICINPGNATYQATGQLEYTAPGFDTEFYYFNNLTLNNVSETINLLLTEGTSVTFNVADQDDDPVENVYIHVLAYDVPTNTYTTTQILKTDSNGNAIGNIILNTQQYKFILIYNNEVKFESSPIVITTTTQNFRIDLIEDFYSDYSIALNTVCDVSFTNSTLTFDFTFADTTGNVNSGNLKVLRRTPNGDTIINTSSLSSSSGTITQKIGFDLGNNSYTYLGIGSISIDGNTYQCGVPESVSFDTRYKTFGDSGIFVTFLFAIAITSVGLWSIPVAIILNTIAIVGSIILGIFYLSWPMLITYIILAIIAVYKVSKE